MIKKEAIVDTEKMIDLYQVDHIENLGNCNYNHD
jgi:hypothetical protein